MSKKTRIIFFVLLTFILTLVNGQDKETLKIMSFNIQIFGAAKMAKPEVVDILVDIVSHADLIAVQEVRSMSIDPVERFMALLPDNYHYTLSPRQGRTFSKEQYWIIYNADKITITNEDSWPDDENIFERSPYAVYCKSSGTFDFILLNNHIQPGAAEKEIRSLPQVAAYYRELWNDPDLLIVGDMNADGKYFNSALMESIFPDTEYYLIFTNEDTTLAQSHNTYDRFIITSSAFEFFTGNFNVIRFDEEYDFDSFSVTPKQVSDHYPIWAEFFIGE